MITNAQQESNKALPLAITSIITFALFLFLYLFTFVNTELSSSTMSSNRGVELSIENLSSSETLMGSRVQTPTLSKEEIYTSENGIVINEKKIKKENSNTLIENFLSSKTKNKLSKIRVEIGETAPNGNPYGTSGTDEITTSRINISTNDLFNLTGRKLTGAPAKITDSKEEGIVVVNIMVDKRGNVIAADPNGRGTSTSSSILKSKAREAALVAKFSPSDKFDEQQGTMVFKFEF